MAAAQPAADFTPFDLDLLLRRGSYTPVTFSFEGTDFTGYGSPVLRFGPTCDTATITVTGALTVTSTTVASIAVTFDADVWTDFDAITAGVYELAIDNPADEPVALVAGRLRIESSFIP